MGIETLPLTARPAMTKPSNRQWSRHWRWILLLAPAAAAMWWGHRSVSSESLPNDLSETHSRLTGVSALGRLSPEGEVIAVAPPTPTGLVAETRVERLMVSVGDEVKVGQVVAILDTNRSRTAIVLEAKAKVEVARAKLAQVQAGPKSEEVRVQEAVVRRLEAGLAASKEEFERANSLVAVRAIATEEHGARRSKFEQARRRG